MQSSLPSTHLFSSEWGDSGSAPVEEVRSFVEMLICKASLSRNDKFSKVLRREHLSLKYFVFSLSFPKLLVH